MGAVGGQTACEGYVPNGVYSCGSLLHGRQLIIPYAMSDYATPFATLSLDTVLAAMESNNGAEFVCGGCTARPSRPELEVGIYPISEGHSAV